MNSYNHHQFAYVSEWFFSALAGLSPQGIDDDGAAVVDIAPSIVDDLEWAEGEREMPRGRVRSRWERVDSGYEVTVTMPWNTRGRVRLSLPSEGATVRLGETPLEANDAGTSSTASGASNGSTSLVDGVRAVSRGDGGEAVIVQIESGTHKFVVSK